MMRVHTVGLDIAKDVFQVHAVDDKGEVVVRRKLSRSGLLGFFKKLQPCLIGIEACGSSHYWARMLAAMGHEVRLMHAAYVKAYVQLHKNDQKDAEAICEAVRRPNMRFVPIKTPEQQSALLLHRTRSILIYQKTALINALRSHFAEFGIVRRPGSAGAAEILALARRVSRLNLPNETRAGLRILAGELSTVLSAIEKCEALIGQWHESNEQSKRLVSIPGIGFLTASAIVATVGDAERFRSGRQFAAWIGLVPRQYSSGGAQRLGHITRAGDQYLRKLLYMGASSALRGGAKSKARAVRWAAGLRERPLPRCSDRSRSQVGANCVGAAFKRRSLSL